MCTLAHVKEWASPCAQKNNFVKINPWEEETKYGVN